MKRAGLLLLCCTAFAMGATDARAQAPCCSVTAVDTATGVVSAKVNATGATFQFKVANAAQLKALRVGQGVYANLSAKQVSLDGKTSCCAIVSTGAATPIRPPVTTVAPGLGASSGSAPASSGPCCTVIALNPQNLITAQNASGKFFVFVLNENGLIRPTIGVGQKVYANFTNNLVSVDGIASAGTIKYLCVYPPNSPCNPPAATCQYQPETPRIGCPTAEVQTSLPASCQAGYYGRNCTKCPPCQSPSVCSAGIGGSGACQN